MSVKLIGLVYGSGLPRWIRPVAAYLAFRAWDTRDGDEFNNIFPAVQTVAEATGLSRSQAQRSMRYLRQIGFLRPVGNTRGGWNRNTTRYQAYASALPPREEQLRPPRKRRARPEPLPCVTGDTPRASLVTPNMQLDSKIKSKRLTRKSDAGRTSREGKSSSLSTPQSAGDSGTRRSEREQIPLREDRFPSERRAETPAPIRDDRSASGREALPPAPCPIGGDPEVWCTLETPSQRADYREWLYDRGGAEYVAAKLRARAGQHGLARTEAEIARFD